MLSYIDIEAFATANYRAATKPSSTSQEIPSVYLTNTQLTLRRKQMAKRILAATKQTRDDRPNQPANTVLNP